MIDNFPIVCMIFFQIEKFVDLIRKFFSKIKKLCMPFTKMACYI